MYTIEAITLQRVAMPLSQGYSTLWYGYVDESGDPGPFSKQTLLLTAVLTQNPRDLELLIHRLSRKVKIRSRGGEIKASEMPGAMIIQFLRELNKLQIEILAVEIDKSVIKKPPHDPETLYGEAISILIRNCLHKHPRLELHIDKRYSNPNRQKWLERSIRDGILDLPRVSLVIEQEDSNAYKLIQIADIVAWSLGRYARGDDRFWQIIHDKVYYCEKVDREIWD